MSGERTARFILLWRLTRVRKPTGRVRLNLNCIYRVDALYVIQKTRRLKNDKHSYCKPSQSDEKTKTLQNLKNIR